MVACLSGELSFFLVYPQLSQFTTEESGCFPTGSSSPLPGSDLKLELQHPAAAHTSGRAPQDGGHRVAVPTVCAGHSLLPSAHWCSPSVPADSPLSPCWWEDFPGYGNLSSFTAPSLGHRSHPVPFSLIFCFIFFCPTWLHWAFLALFESWGLLSVFSRCSVQIIPFVKVFLMYLWKEISSKSYSSAILVPSYNACDLWRNVCC